MKKTMILVLCMIAFNANSFAETRAGPYTPDQLYEMSSLVFEGTVVAIETTDDKFEKTFPIKASVDSILKGSYAFKTISLKHKNPGRSLIHPLEYNVPSIGQTGVFYVVEYEAGESKEFLLIAYHAQSGLHIVKRVRGDGSQPKTTIDGLLNIDKKGFFHEKEKFI